MTLNSSGSLIEISVREFLRSYIAMYSANDYPGGRVESYTVFARLCDTSDRSKSLHLRHF